MPGKEPLGVEQNIRNLTNLALVSPARPKYLGLNSAGAEPSLLSPAKPWEVHAQERSRQARSLLVQAALSAPTLAERDIILEALAELPDPGEMAPTRWPGQEASEDQLSLTQPVVRRSASNTGAKSAGSDDKRPDTQHLDRGKPKHETASSTGSNDSRPVLPRGSVAAMATCCVAVQTDGSLSLWDSLTPATVTSTATQTLDDVRSLHHWRAWLELPLPTAMLEQMQERLRNIAQDMYILNRSCGEELVRSSLARAREAAPKKRRRAGRNRVRLVKQARSDTVEESISSTDEVAPKRKRARVYKGSQPSSTTHITSVAILAQVATSVQAFPCCSSDNRKRRFTCGLFGEDGCWFYFL